MRWAFPLGLSAIAVLTLGWARPTPVPLVSAANPAPPTFSVAGGRLRIEVCADDIVRVAFANDDAFFARPSLMAAPKRCTSPAWKLTRAANTATIATAKLRVSVDLKTGAMTFADAAGRPIAAEAGRSLTPATVAGENTHNVSQRWAPNDGERLYGLGQHQQGLLDIKGTDLELRQYNGEIFIPLLVSSRGYGILWDNTSLTRFGSIDPPAWQEIPGTESGAVDHTLTYSATVAGEHRIRVYSAGDIKVDAGGRPVIDHWRQGWLPGEDVGRVNLRAGETVPLRFRWKADIGVKIARVAFQPPVANQATSLWSQVGDGVDYWCIHGPSLDRVISGYRQITGEPPMMPRWAFALWQCRERYRTAAESVAVLDG